MKPLEKHPELARMVRVLRIVVYTLGLGLALFLGVVSYLHYGAGHDTPPEDAGLLTNVALLAGGMIILAMGFVRMQLTKAALEAWSREDVEGFQQKYAQAVLFGSAGIEGAGLFLGTAFLLEKDPMTLTAGVLCWLLVLSAVPTRNRVNGLLETRT